MLQPETDNIPFGLALSWHRQSAVCHPVTSDHAPLDDDLYELQYVLDGEGEVSVSEKLSAPEVQLFTVSGLLGFLHSLWLVGAVMRQLWGAAKHCNWRQYSCPNREGMVSA